MYKKLFPSLEAIQQQDGKFFKELTDVIHLLRTEYKNPYKWSKSEFALLEKVINKYTALYLRVELNELGFSVHVPSISKWDPLSKGSDFSIQLINKFKKDGILKGVVDPKTGLVKGDFTRLFCEVFIEPKAFMEDVLSDEEIAAFMLHEIGHVVTYFEYLSRSITTNWALKEINDGLLSVDNEKERLTLLIATLGEITDGRVNLVELSKIKDINTIANIVIADQTNASISDLGTDIYDSTSWEYLSDQYVSRHTAGRYLITGYDKYYGHNRPKPIHSHLLIEGLKAIGFSITLPLVSWFLPVRAIMPDPFNGYDRPELRLSRIRLDMVRNLKNRNLPDSLRRTLREDIEYIDSIIKLGKDRLSFLQFYMKQVSSLYRSRLKQEKLQFELEKIASSDLFIKAFDLEKIF